ncbi:MAG: HAMP domain-containing histidine kinase, partial [Solirubrobacterales bacterium]|nr:HAMP domain-containing histidine kinase [Solirubrobacterales bacterium]
TGAPNARELEQAVVQLRRRSGGQVTILDSTLDVVYPTIGRDLNLQPYFPEARRALDGGRVVHSMVGDELIAAERVHIARRHYVVIVQKRLQYVASAFNVVRGAFIEAAGAGLLIALILGVGLASTLLRRLERLRDATRELERAGLDAPVHSDSSRDEIGELARAFAGMQGRLHRQETARRAFVATASHELRTPLASLDGLLELLEEDLSAEHLDLEDARERTARAREQSRRLSRLASDLLDLSRLDAEVELRNEPLELGELCRAVAAEFELAAAHRHVTINLRRAAEPCWALGDPGAVARIVRILLDNALRVAPPGSQVDLRTATGLQRATIEVADRGPGVDPAERDVIFERFMRGSATGGSSGFGLGLAIGRELAQRMGGMLELLPDPPGERGGAYAGAQGGAHPGERGGARFVLRLEPAEVGAEQAPRPERPERATV